MKAIKLIVFLFLLCVSVSEAAPKRTGRTRGMMNNQAQQVFKGNNELQKSLEEVEKVDPIFTYGLEEEGVADPYQDIYATTTEGELTQDIPLSILERSYESLFLREAFAGVIPPRTPLRQIGYELFQSPQAFPTNTIRDFNPSLLLTEGDRLFVATYGSQDLSFEATVDAKMQVFFPKIGIINVAGLSFEKAEKRISEKFQKYYIDSKVYMQLLSRTDRSLYVIGRVKHAGLKIIPSRIGLLEAIMMSGGILKNGSLRNIEISKGANKTQVDLYDLLITGRWNPQILKGGERIFIPSIKATVGVFGEVLEPGIYELTKEANLATILEKAQGITSLGSSHLVNIFRPSNDQNKVDVFTVEKKDYALTQLKPFDLIQIIPRDHLTGNSFSINGAVHYPGVYQIRPKESLKSAIELAGGFKRLHGKVIFIERKLSQGLDISLPEKGKGVVVSEALELTVGNEDFDTALIQAGDIITVPTTDPTKLPANVSIKGEVNNPEIYPYLKGMNLYHLLSLAGGLTEKANIDKLTVSRPVSDFEVNYISLPKEGHLGQQLKSVLLSPGDVVTIPAKTEKNILVTVNGEFEKPGTYLLRKGARLSDLISAAGGLRSSAYTKGASFYRASVAKKYDEQLQKMADRLEQDLIRNQTDQIEGALESQQAKNAMIFGKQERLVSRLRESKSPGRVAITIPQDLSQFRHKPDNIILENNDLLQIPSEPSTVNIIGQANNPNTVVYASQYKLKDYLNYAGGLTKNADTKNIFVIRANGIVVPADLIDRGSKSWFSGRSKSNSVTSIEPGDTILIPEDFEIQENKLQLTKDITTIMFQVISSLGVVVAAF
ncbi:MAG: SLBB domain-containing protein [Planctomycetes bacterium]|nr:SLBB domain-containing protein [Planctomycetota bacterium]